LRWLLKKLHFHPNVYYNYLKNESVDHYIYIIPEGRAAGSFRFLNLHHYMGITLQTPINVI